MEQNLAQPESAQNWNGFALGPIFYERPNSFTAFIRRKLADADKATIRATEEGHTERLAELTAYKVAMRKLLAWPGQGFAPIPPPMPGYAPAEPEYIDRVERVEEPDLLRDIPNEFRGMLQPDESPEKFTERMRRRYRYLKHMQMDAAKPTPSRALPDMNDEERAEMEDLQARGAEAIAWLERE